MTAKVWGFQQPCRLEDLRPGDWFTVMSHARFVGFMTFEAGTGAVIWTDSKSDQDGPFLCNLTALGGTVCRIDEPLEVVPHAEEQPFRVEAEAYASVGSLGIANGVVAVRCREQHGARWVSISDGAILPRMLDGHYVVDAWRVVYWRGHKLHQLLAIEVSADDEAD